VTPHFANSELACTHCGQAVFHPGFLDALEAARVDFGLPMKVSGPARCKAHNAAVKGHAKSLHIWDEPQHPGQEGCLGLDFEAADGAYRGKLFSTLWKHGFSIGWNAKRKFLHADRRDLIGLPQTSFDY
jgi:hypothetical protein